MLGKDNYGNSLSEWDDSNRVGSQEEDVNINVKVQLNYYYEKNFYATVSKIKFTPYPWSQIFIMK